MCELSGCIIRISLALSELVYSTNFHQAYTYTMQKRHIFKSIARCPMSVLKGNDAV